MTFAILICGNACSYTNSNSNVSETTENEETTSFDTVDTTNTETYLDSYPNYVEVYFTAEQCEILFGCTLDEFFYQDIELCKEIGDVKSKSYIDQHNLLHMVMTEKQAELLLESEWLWDFTDDEKNVEYDLKISSDFKSITCYCTEDRYYDVADYLEKTAYRHCFNVGYKLIIVQMLKKVPLTDLYVAFVFADPLTNEVFSSHDFIKAV